MRPMTRTQRRHAGKSLIPATWASAPGRGTITKSYRHPEPSPDPWPDAAPPRPPSHAKSCSGPCPDAGPPRPASHTNLIRLFVGITDVRLPSAATYDTVFYKDKAHPAERGWSYVPTVPASPGPVRDEEWEAWLGY